MGARRVNGPLFRDASAYRPVTSDHKARSGLSLMNGSGTSS